MPNIPKISGLNDDNAVFKGEVIHSWQYRDPYKYIDKRVLIIGVGNSGGDIAVELSRIASQVYLSTRTGMWCVPRISKYGVPGDLNFLKRILNLINSWFPSYFINFGRNVMNERFDHELYSTKPLSDKAHHVFVNDDLPNRLASGTLIIKPNYKEFKERSCIFEDETIVNDIDLIVLATGFKIGFPLFDDSIITVKNNWVNLYKYVFPPQLKQPTLAVMGCIQPLGAINPIVELQARWAIRVFKGLVKLPSKEQMDEDIALKARKMRTRYMDSPRHTIQVDWISFQDEIAELIGCKPTLSMNLKILILFLISIFKVFLFKLNIFSLIIDYGVRYYLVPSLHINFD